MIFLIFANTLVILIPLMNNSCIHKYVNCYCWNEGNAECGASQGRLHVDSFIKQCNTQQQHRTITTTTSVVFFIKLLPATEMQSSR